MAVKEEDGIREIMGTVDLKPRAADDFASEEMGWTSDLPNENGKLFDSADEIATKKALQHFLAASSIDTCSVPELPVQGEGAEKWAANQLFQLFFQSYRDGDAKQNIHSQLYQDENGHIIFCRDARCYDKDKPIDPIYEYARYGIGLYLSQHILYQAYGIGDTQFIADNAEKFYQRFIEDIESYRVSLSLSDKELAQALDRYARSYLANIAYSIAEQLTDRLGPQHEAFNSEESSLAALDTTLVSATMACEPIPYVAIQSIGGTEYASIIHPKPFHMTADLQAIYEDGSQFLDQNPVKQRLIAHLLLPGRNKVTLCSQDRSKLVGAKNVRKRESLKIVREANERVQGLLSLTKTAASSTTFSALRGIDEDTLQEYNTTALLQEYEMLAPGDGEQAYGLTVASLCGVDIVAKTGIKKIDPLDSKIVKNNKQSARHEALRDKMSNNNVAINFECVFGKFRGNSLTSKSVQKLLEVATGEEESAEMLEDLYNVSGMKADLHSILAFKETLGKAEQYRLNQYLLLMNKALQKRANASFLDSLRLSIDVVAVFVLLCQQYNQLLAKNPCPGFKTIVPAINCASGENRTGVVLQRIDILSMAADVVGIDEVPELLDEKYADLLLEISDEVANIGVTLWENGYFGSTPGTGGIRAQTGKNALTGFSKQQKLALMCSSSDWKRLGDVYKKEENRVDVWRMLNELCHKFPNMRLEERRKNYRKMIAEATPFSILYTLHILRDPTLLSHLPAEDMDFIEALLVEKEAQCRHHYSIFASSSSSSRDRGSVYSERSQSEDEWSDSEDNDSDSERAEDLINENLPEGPGDKQLQNEQRADAVLPPENSTPVSACVSPENEARNANAVHANATRVATPLDTPLEQAKSDAIPTAKYKDTRRLSASGYAASAEKQPSELESATFMASVGVPIVLLMLFTLGAHVTIPLLIGGLAMAGIGYLTYRLIKDSNPTSKKIAVDKENTAKELPSSGLPSRLYQGASAFFSRLNPLNKKTREEPTEKVTTSPSMSTVKHRLGCG